MTTSSPWPAPAEAHGARPSAAPLTVGFYLAALAAMFMTTCEIRPPRLPGFASFTIVELLLYPVALCLVIEVLLRPSLAQHLRALYRQNRAIAWYAGYAAIASILGLSRSGGSLQIYKDVLPGLILYVLVFLTIDSHARLVGMLLANLAGAMLSVGLGLCQVATGGPYPVPLSTNIEFKLDLSGNALGQIPTGMFAHPNSLALGVLPACVFLVVAVWPGFARTRRLGPGMLGLLLATLLVLLLAYVKGIYAWLAAGLFVIVLPRRFDSWRFRLSIGLVVAGIATLTWMSIRAFLEGESLFGTIVGRVELWLACIDVIRADGFVAVLGSGDASFEALQPLVTIDYGNAHNAWLNQALTYGVPALFLYLAGFWVALRSLARTISRSDGPRRTVALATMGALTALLGEYFFEPADRGVVFQAQLFILFGLAALCRRSQPPRTDEDRTT